MGELSEEHWTSLRIPFLNAYCSPLSSTCKTNTSSYITNFEQINTVLTKKKKKNTTYSTFFILTKTQSLSHRLQSGADSICCNLELYQSTSSTWKFRKTGIWHCIENGYFNLDLTCTASLHCHTRNYALPTFNYKIPCRLELLWEHTSAAPNIC